MWGAYVSVGVSAKRLWLGVKHCKHSIFCKTRNGFSEVNR
jgi:hypothetical protein